jgi:hypothetical protein
MQRGRPVRVLVAVAGAVALLACPSKSTCITSWASAPKLPVADMPSSAACTTDDDCTIVPDFDVTGCCAQADAAPLSKRYIEAVHTWGKTHCGEYTCPPTPFPGARPADCFFTARCLGGVCRTSCDSAADAAAAPTTLPTVPPLPLPATERKDADSEGDIPPGGCIVQHVIYDESGQVYGCGYGGGNWCSAALPLPGGCRGPRQPPTYPPEGSPCPSGSRKAEEVGFCGRPCWTPGYGGNCCDIACSERTP